MLAVAPHLLQVTVDRHNRTVSAGHGQYIGHIPHACESDVARSSSRRTSEEGGQLGGLGGMHHREDLVSRLQDEVRTWDQELTTADDRRQCTLIRQWQVTEGLA